MQKNKVETRNVDSNFQTKHFKNQLAKDKSTDILSCTRTNLQTEPRSKQPTKRKPMSKNQTTELWKFNFYLWKKGVPLQNAQH